MAFEHVSDDALSAKALAAFRKLDEWKQTQSDFRDSGEKGKWDSVDSPPTVLVVRHPKTGATWAVVHASGGRGCGDFGADMSAIFERRGSSWTHHSTSGSFKPLAAFDLDGDDAPEFIGDGAPDYAAPRVLVDDTGGGFGSVAEFTFLYADCPC